MKHRLLATITILTVLLLPAVFAQTSKNAEFSDLEVRVDDVDAKKVLDVKVGDKYTEQFLQADNPYCRAAAVLVAQEAVSQYGVEAKSISFGKDFFLKTKDIADMIGEKRISKIAQLGASIMEGFEYDDPYAAVGKAIVKESADWVIDQIPKTDQKQIDDFIKDKAGKVRDKLNESLFPGQNRKVPYTAHVKIGECKVDVIAETQLPGEKTGRGGIRLFVSGDCSCKKPLRLNSRFGIPTNFRAQTEQIKDCGLGRFTLIAFLPMTALNTDVSFDGRKVDLKKAVKLIGGVKKLINGEKSDQTPDEIADEIQKQAGNLTKVKKTVLTLKPEFAKEFEIESLAIAQCDNCEQKPAGAQTPPPAESAQLPVNVDAKLCGDRCGELYKAWKKEENASQTQFGKAWESLPADIAREKNEISTAEKELAKAKLSLDKANQTVKGFQENAQRAGLDPDKPTDDFGESYKAKWEEAVNGKRAREGDVAKWQSRLATARKNLTELDGQAAHKETKGGEQATKETIAKAAYYECARCCWNEARSAKPDIKVPDDVLAWEKDHPIDARLVGTWRSETVTRSLAPYKTGGAGIIMTIKDDGTITMDYNQMEPFKRDVPAQTTMWSGKASGKIKTCKNEAWLVSVEKSELTHKTTVAGGKDVTNPLKSTGPAAIAETDKHIPYEVDETTLKYSHGPESYTFKRQEAQTKQRTTTGSGR